MTANLPVDVPPDFGSAFQKLLQIDRLDVEKLRQDDRDEFNSPLATMGHKLVELTRVIQPNVIREISITQVVEVIALARGDVKSFLRIHIEKAKADGTAAILVRKPAIEKWNDRLPLRANNFGRPDLIG